MGHFGKTTLDHDWRSGNIDREHTVHYYDRLQANLRAPANPSVDAQRRAQQKRVRQDNNALERRYSELKEFLKQTRKLAT